MLNSETFSIWHLLQNYWLQYHCKTGRPSSVRNFVRLPWIGTVSSVNWKRADMNFFVPDYVLLANDEVCCRGPTRTAQCGVDGDIQL